MSFFANKRIPDPRDWGLQTNAEGELMSGGASCLALAERFGTPLHVVDEDHLGQTARDFISAFGEEYGGPFFAHYAFKCNPVPGVIAIVRQNGFKAEIMSAFELVLAKRLGFRGEDIIVNGPYKPESFLDACLEENVQLIIVDSSYELSTLNRLAARRSRVAPVLLRINPDYVPKGMNSGTATGSRKNCAFGLDIKSGEAERVLDELPALKNIRFMGFHFHIGSGICHADDYYNAICRLKGLVRYAIRSGFEVRIFDVGGGFAAPFSREMNNWELLRYTLTNRLPKRPAMPPRPGFRAFAEAVSKGIHEIFQAAPLPVLIAEPGRSITSAHQMLLLGVQQVKERPGAGNWITTDGGIGTVTMPTYYEYHEIFLCNDIRRPRSRWLTINGPGCFAADQVYRNKWMPEVNPNEVLAVMDSGAYFTSWESSFGFPRPAVVAVSGGMPRLLRRRETLEEMMERDQSLLQTESDATVIQNT